MKKSLKKIYSDNPWKSTDFYSSLFEFEVVFESNWLIHLVSDYQRFDLCIMGIDYNVVQHLICDYPQEYYLKFHSENIDELFEVAIQKDLPILQEPHATYCGRRRFLLKDPDDTFVEVSTITPKYHKPFWAIT